LDDERDDETADAPLTDADAAGSDAPDPEQTTDEAPGAPVEVAGPDVTAPDSDEGEDESVLPPGEVRAIVEALVFAAPQPLTAREIGRVLQGVPKERWQQALEELQQDYAREERGLQLIEVASGWQITTRPEYNDWVRELLDPKTPTRLSIQALETLSVIAYRQPVTLPEIIELRGVRSQGVVKTLLEKRLIRITGRKEVVGRPMLYGTTRQFLLHFGLKDLEELPQIEEFAEVLGEEVDIPGLKKAIEAPRPAEVPLSEGDGSGQGTLFDQGEESDGSADGENASDEGEDTEEAEPEAENAGGDDDGDEEEDGDEDEGTGDEDAEDDPKTGP
jgi:segregation and condensation protein B